jgi:hypothetical protein
MTILQHGAKILLNVISLGVGKWSTAFSKDGALDWSAILI